MNFLNRALWWLQHKKSRHILLKSIPVFFDSTVEDVFSRFDRFLTDRTSTVLEPLYKLRFQEIGKLVLDLNIQTICEFGSGRTTFLFNLFENVKTVSYEQDSLWRDTVIEFFVENGLPIPQIELADVELYLDGGRFSNIQIMPCDFLYIDGPYVKRGESVFGSFARKPVYYDFERVFSSGLPKVVMVEGRTDTVDAILKSSFSERYDFYGELTWALERREYSHAFYLRRHSIFIRKF